MHGSPWLRASEATRVRRRQNVEVGRLGDGGLGDGGLGDGGIFIGVFSDVRVLNELLGLQHDLAHNPLEVSDRAAGILRMCGYMLSEGLRLRSRHIIRPIEVFNGATGKCRIAIRKLSERLFPILHRFVDGDL